jgi:molybdopterin/thiamine biosynthesis adenylyltransferase
MLGKPNEQCLVVDRRVHKQLVEEARQSLAQRRERCGFLLGGKRGEKVYVFAITTPGPQATLTGGHCEPDYAHAAQTLAQLEDQYQDVTIVGGWHTHLGYGDQLSGGDRATLKQTSERYPGFVALLINVERDGQMSFNAYVRSDSRIERWVYQVGKVKPQPRSDSEQRVRRAARSERFQRMHELVSPLSLAKKGVLIVGLGSGGSTVASFLARTGIFYFGLVDHETLQEVNLSRHIGLPQDIGRQKVEIVKEKLEAINPEAQVEALNFDVLADSDRLRALIAEYDLVLACTGHPQINHVTNQLALEVGTPAVYAGVFPRGVGGYVLQVSPEQETACFNCLFSLTKEGYPTDSDQLLQQTAQQYGLNAQELHAQQGLYVDIGFVALLQAKAAIVTLLRGSNHEAGEWPGNLILWNARDLTLERGHLARREDCSVCNPEGWLAMRQASMTATVLNPEQRQNHDDAGD